jgi:hypothetical protein
MMRNTIIAVRWRLTAASALLALALPAAAFAADAAKEAATSATHAGLAAKAGTIEQVHMHLHHAVNCLVGPKGQGFDAKEANPCQQLGDGAIPDTADAATKGKLAAALASAEAGLKSDNLETAKKAAAAAESALK